MGNIITLDKSVAPACDVETSQQLLNIVRATRDVKGIQAYKIGFYLGLDGLQRMVGCVKTSGDRIVIYDHQKAGTDIPDTGKLFARKMKEADVDYAILFPQAGPVTQEAWTKYLQDADVIPIIGGEMTHKRYKTSEGGYISDEALERMYINGAGDGATHFVVPGNKLDRIEIYKKLVIEHGVKDPIFFAPGFIAQGGEISEAAKVAGDRWHAIAGRGIYNPNKKENLNDVTEEEIHEAAIRLTSQLFESD